MPAPRVFVSSTCYDLQSIRESLRAFIADFGFEPVMSEYGDIFYGYDKHIHDACIAEIEKCQLFIVIIGNSYGSFYHKDVAISGTQDSVTVKEFRRALEVDIPKHIFIEQFVHHDHASFTQELRRRLRNHFENHEVSDEDTKIIADKIRAELDGSYPFREASYRSVFHFLDLISELKVNNAVFPFASFPDIREQLRKQWAGYMYERLTASKTVPVRTVERLAAKLDSQERLLKDLIATKTEEAGELSVNIERMAEQMMGAELEEAQEMLANCLDDIMWTYDAYNRGQRRGILCEEIDHEKILKWLSSLDGLLNTYKWAKSISFSELWSSFQRKTYLNRDIEIPLTTIIKLDALHKRIPGEEEVNFARTISLKLKPIIEPEKQDDTDDLPF